MNQLFRYSPQIKNLSCGSFYVTVHHPLWKTSVGESFCYKTSPNLSLLRRGIERLRAIWEGYLLRDTLVLLLLLCNTLPAHARLCQPGQDNQAQSYYQQARQAETYEQRLAYLEQAESICSSFQILLAKGDALLRIKHYTDALTTLSGAESLVSDSLSAKTQLYGLQGAAFYHNGHFAEARLKTEVAYDLYRHELMLPPPKLVFDTIKKLDDRDVQRIVPDTEISNLLAAKKGAGIMPAISLFINFDTDKANLSQRGYQQILQLSQALQTYLDDYDVLLIGHTDNRGTEAYNMRLSQRRAETVSSYLSRQNPNPKNVFPIRGKGESELRYQGETLQDHFRNRRVEVNLVLRPK